MSGWFIEPVDLAVGQKEIKVAAPTENQVNLAKENRQLYNNVRGVSWTKWRTDSSESYDFSLGDQLTEEQENDLIAAGMPTFTVDKISQSIETLKFFITANDPRFIAIGADRSDSASAAIHSAVFRHILYVSNFRSIFSQITEDALGKSLGYLFMRIDKDLDNGAGEVVVDFLNPWDVYVDPASTDIMFRDASFVMVKKNFTKEYLINALPQFKQRILDATGTDEHNDVYSSRNTATSLSIQPGDVTGMIDKTGTVAEVIDYYERYFKKKVKYISLALQSMPDKDQLDEINKRVEAEVQLQAKKMNVELESTSIALDDQVKDGSISQERAAFEKQKGSDQMNEALGQLKNQLLTKAISEITQTQYMVVSEDEYKLMKEDKLYKDRIVSAVPYWQTRIGVICSIGGETFLYEDEIPISNYPMVPIPYRHTGTPFPLSAVRKVVGKQKEVNKAHQIMVHNASLGSSLRWLHQAGAIFNEKEWDDNVTIPGARLKYNLGYEAPSPILPMQLANAFYDIAGKGEMDIEESLGASPIGLSANAPSDMPYKGLALVDETSTRRIRSWMSTVVEPALEHFGKTLTELAQKVYTNYKVLRIVDPDTGKLEKYEINVPMYGNLGTVTGRFHDFATNHYDIRIVAGSTLPKNKRLELAERLELYKLQIIDDIAVLDKTDLPDKEEIMARKSLYMRMKDLINRLETELSNVKGDHQTMKRQLDQLGVKMKLNDFDKELTNALSEFKATLAAREAKAGADLKAAVSIAEADLKAAVAIKKASTSK